MDFSNGTPSSVVKIKKDDNIIIEAGIGEGTIDAIFKTIDRITTQEGKLLDYKVQSVSKGKDALASVTVKVSFNGEPAIIGHGLNIDTMLASARAYIGALNSYLSMEGKLKSRFIDSSKTV
jgi:2-isopropylmalate synthase